MAFVKSVERSARLPKEQPTEVVCYWSFNPDKSLLQLETKGSMHRINSGITSQSLQFDRESARQLCEVLRNAFRFEP